MKYEIPRHQFGPSFRINTLEIRTLLIPQRKVPREDRINFIYSNTISLPLQNQNVSRPNWLQHLDFTPTIAPIG